MAGLLQRFILLVFLTHVRISEHGRQITIKVLSRKEVMEKSGLHCQSSENVIRVVSG